ncbi:hypothetical protein ACF07D_04700 [Leucobacter sp. NPDC015123]|uniref:hypothetical protein n=1 Tax=Leucobacter sp. NPDC015123 TaxID=3364129 RepID=UPI0036F49938
MAEDSKSVQVTDAVVRTTLLPLVVTLIVDVVLRTTGVDLGGYQTLVAAAAGYVGYAVVRFLEVYVSPKWGYILGLKVASAPTYKGRYAA